MAVRRHRCAAWVIKLGGSLAESPSLRPWLDVIAGGGGRLVLVPGGGVFADTVRRMQDFWRFGDGPAHRMAVLAMEQYGLMLTGLHPRLRPAGSRAEIRRSLERGEVPVWMPGRMVLGHPSIPESWDVTSDSLAAWLAAALGAEGLILVKSVSIQEGSPVDALAQRGLVDPLLPRFVGGIPACLWTEADRHREMADALRLRQVAGTPVALEGAAGPVVGSAARANIRPAGIGNVTSR